MEYFVTKGIIRIITEKEIVRAYHKGVIPKRYLKSKNSPTPSVWIHAVE